MEHNFCRRCGEKLIHQQGVAYKCANKHTIYVNAAPCAGLFLLDERDQVLLAKRAVEPFLGKLNVPGGYLDGLESHEEALVREVREELGLGPDDYDTPRYLTSATTSYQEFGETKWVVSVFYWARVKSGLCITASDDIESPAFYDLGAVENEAIAFSDIREGLRKLAEIVSSK